MLDGCALLDLDVEFIRNGAAQGLCSAVVEPEDVRKALEKCEYLPAAVYITSPDYLGVLSDVAGIAAVCHEKGTLLAVEHILLFWKKAYIRSISVQISAVIPPIRH